MDQPTDRIGKAWQRATVRLALVVAVTGVVCSLALGVLVHQTVRRLDNAQLLTQADLSVDAVRLRLDRLQAGLSAAAAFLRHADAGPEALYRFTGETVMQSPGVLGLLLRGEDGTITPIAARADEVLAPGDPLLSPLLAGVDPAPGMVDAALDPVAGLLVLGAGADGRGLLLIADLTMILVQADQPGADWRSVRLLSAGEPVPDGALARRLAVAGQPWGLALQPMARGPLSTFPWEGLAVTCFGLGLTLLTVAHARNIQRRSQEKGELAARLRLVNTELRRRMAERERLDADLRDSEHKYRDIYENALEGIFTSTPEGRLLSANPSMARMLGYASADELMAEVEDVARQIHVDPERRAEFVRILIREGTVRDFEAQARRKDGSMLWMSLAARAVRQEGTAGTRVVAIQGTAQDVTARRRAEEELRLAKEQADFANRAKTEFLSNMSHELRTPLNAIIGFSEIIGDQAMGPINNPAYAEYARDIHESGRMLLDLINDILDLSKIEAGRKEINERTVDVPRLVRLSMRLVRERALKGGLALHADLPDGLPPVWADEVALKQILSNLLSNAVKFTPSGGSVTIGAQVEPDGRLLLTVRDTGIGIRPEDIPKALEPFQQIEGSLTRTAGGVGLGLPLVRALVSLHDGDFMLESEPGIGTVARVWLPADRVRLPPGPVLPQAGAQPVGA